MCVVAVYVYATPSNSASSVSQRFAPTETSAVLSGLLENTEYTVTVVMVTDEYFDQLPSGHESKASRKLPRDRPPAENVWIPSASVKAVTSGTVPPSELTVSRKTATTATLEWRSPVVHGTN